MTYLGKTVEAAFHYGAKSSTCRFAKKLRHRTTASEKILWKRLKAKNIFGAKFRRQHPVGPFIADFYCHEIQLVIEVDGPIHTSLKRREYDAKRDAAMHRMGLTVIRFTNFEIRNKIGKVMTTIKTTILTQRDSMKPSPPCNCVPDARHPSGDE